MPPKRQRNKKTGISNTTINAIIDKRIDLQQQVQEETLQLLNKQGRLIVQAIGIVSIIIFGISVEILGFKNSSANHTISETENRITVDPWRVFQWVFLTGLFLLALLRGLRKLNEKWIDNRLNKHDHWVKILEGDLTNIVELNQLEEINNTVKTFSNSVDNYRQILRILFISSYFVTDYIPLLSLTTIMEFYITFKPDYFRKGSLQIDSNNIDKDAVKLLLNEITGDYFKSTWDAKIYKGYLVFSLMDKRLDQKSEQLLYLLKQAGFIVLGKTQGIVVTRTQPFEKKEADEIRKKFQEIINIMDAAKNFKEALKQASSNFYRSWHFQFANINELPVFISTISFSEENITKDLYEQLHPLLEKNIERQFNTIIIRGCKNQDAVCEILSSWNKHNINIHEISHHAATDTITVNDTTQPVTKIKNRGTPRTNPLLSLGLFSSRQVDTLTWQVAINGGFVTVNHNEGSIFMASAADVKYLYSHGNIDYYAVLDTQNIPKEAVVPSQRAFEHGYRINRPGKTRGQCISEGNLEKDGCTHKIRLSTGGRIKHYTAETQSSEGRTAKLLYFSIYENATQAHDQHRRKFK